MELNQIQSLPVHSLQRTVHDAFRVLHVDDRKHIFIRNKFGVDLDILFPVVSASL